MASHLQHTDIAAAPSETIAGTGLTVRRQVGGERLERFKASTVSLNSNLVLSIGARGNAIDMVKPEALAANMDMLGHLSQQAVLATIQAEVPSLSKSCTTYFLGAHGRDTTKFGIDVFTLLGKDRWRPSVKGTDGLIDEAQGIWQVLANLAGVDINSFKHPTAYTELEKYAPKLLLISLRPTAYSDQSGQLGDLQDTLTNIGWGGGGFPVNLEAFKPENVTQ